MTTTAAYITALCLCWAQQDAGAGQHGTSYAESVLKDEPVAYWRLNGDDLQSHDGQFSGEVVGAVGRGAGPRSNAFPEFEQANTGRWFASGSGRIVVKDTAVGEKFPLRFHQGDSMTLEAWVNVGDVPSRRGMYVVGKGRTQNPGKAANNQNYALRLISTENGAFLSFLFRDAEERSERADDYHRWTSTTGVAADHQWHYVAVTYEFGKPESIAGYIDGRPVKGQWELGGATAEAPVVDDDELWIGASQGGNSASAFVGGIDEVAIYRKALAADRIATRFRKAKGRSYSTPEDSLVENKVLVEIFHGIPDNAGWDFAVPVPFERYVQDDWALNQLPQVYNGHGVRVDRGSQVMVRLSGRYSFPPGEHRLLLRTRSAGRVYLDGEMVVENERPTRSGTAFGALYDVVSHVSPHIRALRPGDYEKEVRISGKGVPQLLSVDLFVGGKNRRLDPGEMCLAIGDAEGHFNVMTHGAAIPLTDEGWERWARTRERELAVVNGERRRLASTGYASDWEKRHDSAREWLAARPLQNAPVGEESGAVHNEIDRSINSKLRASNVAPLPLTDDFAFLRRVCLDVIGSIPTPEIEKSFLAIPEGDRRSRIIDWLLEQPGWADHWVSYWQDVLAENPTIVTATMSNTGPFRYWLQESFTDNKPFDRFATELILMEGSRAQGGPAGFAMSTQNDAPMAAKAQILARAFLGMKMDCARCHDAPSHSFTQHDLFSIAAMLDRKPVVVPTTSTIPGDEKARGALSVVVTLKPGQSIPPEWPFRDQLSGDVSTARLDDPRDSREQLAALVTSPENRRFAQVAVNRLWHRYFGMGLVDPVDDWEAAQPSHPELLEYLERELILSGYDLKHVARLILNSHAYQRRPACGPTDSKLAHLFPGPAQRRMTAEQVVDSLYVAAAKQFRTEELSIGVDGLRGSDEHSDFGFPTRAWQFAPVLNDRDRPSLSLPASQTFLDILEPFGWRPSRPDALTVRPAESTVLQPAILANGVAAKRITQFSDDSRFTELALNDLEPEEFVEGLFRSILSRPPSAKEMAWATELLTPGYDERRRLDRPSRPLLQRKPTGVSWSNHFLPEANERKIAFAEEIAKGDPATERLSPEWRERAEDLVWALINSPEFVVIP